MTKTEPQDAPPKPRRRPLAGADLLPDLNPEIATTERRWYWVGATRECPVESVDLCGINFPKLTERVEGEGKETRRSPQVGALVQLTKRDIEALRKKIALTVIRFHPTPEDAPPNFRRRGHLITTPTAEENRKRVASKLPERSYTQGPLDEAVAFYIYALPCENQDAPHRQQTFQVLAETGLTWD